MKLTNFNIVWYVLCWNEMPILPFMIDYWKLIASKVIVLDNNSDDGSVEYLKQYDWIEVRPYPIDTNNQLNDEINMNIKNMCWKELKWKNVDFVIVSDLDEILFAKNLQERLEYVKNNNIDVIIPFGYDFVSLTFPEYREDILLHELIQTCMRLPFWDKPICFIPDNVEEINYTPGAHTANPKCINKNEQVEGLFLLHFKYLSLEYLITKRLNSVPRMSDVNKQHRWGHEYLDNKDLIRQQFNSRWEDAKNNYIETIL